MDRIFVGLTGASGARYGTSLVRALVENGVRVSLCVSESGAKVLDAEMGLRVDPFALDPKILFPGLEGRISAEPVDRVEAPVSSGSHPMDGAVICPCSMGTLAAVAHGLSGNLIQRAAQVMLKEGRPLILVPRETPLSIVHLRSMLLAAEAGAVVLPASPGFYHRPTSIEDLVNHVVTKITDRLGLRLDLITRWGDGNR